MLLIPSLSGRLGRAPPELIFAVPLDGLAQALGEVVVLWAPAELVAQLGRVDGVAAVVAEAVAHPVEILGVLPHHLEDHAQHHDVVLLAVGADEVGPPMRPLVRIVHTALEWSSV